MSVLLSLFVGLLIGTGVSTALAARRRERLVGDNEQLRGDLARCEGLLAGAGEAMAYERNLHEGQLRGLEQAFESVSHRVMASSVEQLARTSASMATERDSSLGLALKPLERLLSDFRVQMAALDKDHAGALFEVRSRAGELLDAQHQVLAEARRLNTLLGRSDQRGRWGEMQLVNVLERSGLREGIDFDLQVSTTDASGRRLRPDCVVRMPGRALIAVDAKFPFDAFEVAMGTEDAAVRAAKLAEHAAHLRGHVRSLREKSYYEQLESSPEFVVCFVPSEMALGAAMDADPDLADFAARERVLLVGPSTLLGLLWTIAMVLRSADASVNAAEILALAETLVERIRLVAEPVERMGRALGETVGEYNKMVKSVESRLMPIARGVHALGAGRGAKRVSGLAGLDSSVRGVDAERWGVAQGGLFDEVAGDAGDVPT
jgi:DNA recombination protein RmuC